MVNNHSPLHRSLAVDAQLRAQALAADCANKPTGLLILASVLIAASAILLLVSVMGLNASRAQLARAQRYASEIDQLLGAIDDRQSSSIDLAKLYPRLPFLQANTLEQIEKLGIEFHIRPSVSPPRSTPILPRAGIHKGTITCRVNTEPLDQILAWLNGILRYEPHQGNVFVSQISLSPNGMGWQSTFEISVYEHK